MNKTESFTQWSNDGFNLKLIADTWIMGKLKTAPNTFIDLQANAAVISKVFHGEPTIADYTVNPDWEGTPKGSSSDLMFDDDMNTFWLAEGYFDGPKRIEIKFNVRFSII